MCILNFFSLTRITISLLQSEWIKNVEPPFACLFINRKQMRKRLISVVGVWSLETRVFLSFLLFSRFSLLFEIITDQRKYLCDYSRIDFVGNLYYSRRYQPSRQSCEMVSRCSSLYFPVSFSPSEISHLSDPITGPRRLAKQRILSLSYDRYWWSFDWTSGRLGRLCIAGIETEDKTRDSDSWLTGLSEIIVFVDRISHELFTI